MCVCVNKYTCKYVRQVMLSDVTVYETSDQNASPYSGKFLKADLMQYNL